MLYANQKELKSRLVELDKSAFKIASIQTSFVSKDFFMNNLISSILTFIVFTKTKKEILELVRDTVLFFFSCYFSQQFLNKLLTFLAVQSI